MYNVAVLLAILFVSGVAQAGKLSRDDQILHALDRLSYGPKPGDMERVRSKGVKKWIDAQLHPERIVENPVLGEKLAPLDSLRMSLSDIVEHYPSPQVMKAMAGRKRPYPKDPALRAAIENYLDREREKKDGTDVETDGSLENVLGTNQLHTLREGNADEKTALLRGYPPAQLDELILAMPRKMRQQLVGPAPPDVRRKLVLINAPQQVIAQDLMQAKLYRAIYSNRQLGQLLEDFWYNHFNVFLDKGADHFLVPSYERDAIAPHILGKFRDLLEATAKSPAMLFYLDNWESVAETNTPARGPGNKIKRGLNENYGRELLELHTLGVNGGYTQKDVIEVARCFTGWTIDRPGQGGGFRYNDKVHDKGSKVVLGVTIPAGGGMDDGEQVLDILSNHPSTARFISTKLAQRFVGDTPPKSLIDRMAKTFKKKHGDIREVMRAMLGSSEFWSQDAYRNKMKTPFEMIVSAVRALDADVVDSLPLAQQIARLGQPLYRKQEPTGYSSANAEWVNSAALLGRLNFALALTQGKIRGVKVDLAGLGANSDDIAHALLFRDASAETQKAISDSGDRGLRAGLVLGSPDFQRK